MDQINIREKESIPQASKIGCSRGQKEVQGQKHHHGQKEASGRKYASAKTKEKGVLVLMYLHGYTHTRNELKLKKKKKEIAKVRLWGIEPLTS